MVQHSFEVAVAVHEFTVCLRMERTNLLWFYLLIAQDFTHFLVQKSLSFPSLVTHIIYIIQVERVTFNLRDKLQPWSACIST
jgi:hypothetical protein